MRFFDPYFVHNSLDALARRSQPVFGASVHRFRLNPVQSEAHVNSFEKLHSIVLPQDYRHFLLTICDGGAGPYYGVFPLGKMDNSNGLAFQPWKENHGLIGDLSEPFPFKETWNDLSASPSLDLAEKDPEEYERQLVAFEKRYFDPHLLDGAFPICHMGCALRVWLVVTGEQAGRLWRDGRADDSGLSPIFTDDNEPATFSTWYFEWLTNPESVHKSQPPISRK
jgi:hypothetical protein